MRKEKTISRKTLAILLSLMLVIGGVVGGTIAWLTSQSKEVKNTFTPSNVKVELTETTGTEYNMVPGWTKDKNPKAKVEPGSEDCYLFIKITGNNGDITENKDKETGKVTSYNLGDYVVYNIADGWTKLTGVTGADNVFYRVIDADNAGGIEGSTANTRGTEYSILGGGTYTDAAGTVTWGVDQVATKPAVTEQMMEALVKNDDGNNYPTLSFTAYASQLWKSNAPDRNDYTGETAESEYNAAVTAAQFTPAEAWANVPAN